MKLENLPFAIIVLFFAVLALGGTGWAASFIIDMEFKELITDFEVFKLRMFLGVIILGVYGGVCKLVDLFVYVMKMNN